jgi:putative membrane protein
MRFHVLVAAVSVVALGTWGCAERDGSDVDTSTVPFDTGVAGGGGGSSARRDTSPSAPATPDGEALGSFIAANLRGAEGGRLAAQKASAQTVRDLGTGFARDHDDLAARARELGTRLSISPAAHPAGQPASDIASLSSKTGTEFDRAYLQHEVDFHRWFVDQVNTAMLPTATNTELKTFLQQAIPALQAHLKAAQDLLAKQPSM